MNNRTMIAAAVGATATVALAGAFWLGEPPASPAGVTPDLTSFATVPATGADRQVDTLASSTRSIGSAFSNLPERETSGTGSTVYRSLSPEYLTPVQQETGTLCETDSGFCTVPAQPIGSPCRCGEGDTAMIGEITR